MNESNDRLRFVADAMLGSLARKLRALGFDTTYYKSGDDSGILQLAGKESRVLLTSDRQLADRAASRGVAAFTVTGDSDARRLDSIREQASAKGVELKPGEPLCSVCGSRLVRVSRASVEGNVPEQVRASHRDFYRCLGCGKVYWKGSHWKKLRSMGRRLGQNRIDNVQGGRARRGESRKGGH